MVKFKLLVQFPHLAYPVVSSLILSLRLFTAFAYLLIVLSLSLHNLHLLFCSILSIFALTVFMALFCAGIRRDPVSLLRFPFLYHVQVSSCEILLEMSIELFSFPFLFSCFVLLMLVLSVFFWWL